MTIQHGFPCFPIRDIREIRGQLVLVFLRDLRALYVQKDQQTFYYLPPCPRGEERSDEPCGHDRRPTTDDVPPESGRRQARSEPASWSFPRTVGGTAAAATPGALASARQGGSHGCQ